MSLDFLKKQEGIQETTQDKIGGGSFTLDSGLHEARIDKAYLTNSGSSKAVAIAFEFTTTEGKSYKDTIWVTNGEGKNTYLTKDNKLAYLPGFETVSNIALVAVGKELAELTPEDKVIEIYNSELAKKVPTSVQMFTELIGQTIILGLHKVKSFKQAKDPATGKYVDTAETRETNELVNVFSQAGFTALELKAKATEVDFIKQFEEAFKSDYVKDKTKGRAAGATPGVGAGVSNNPTKSLFGAGAK